MKKLLATVAALVAVSASAQTANFEGPSVALNMDMVGSSTKLGFGDATLNGLGQSALGASLQAGYGFALSKDTVLTVGATMGLTSLKALEVTDQFSAKVKDTMSIYIEPGLALTDKTLAYGKVSFDSAKLAASGSDGSAASKKINGTGYGLGLRTMLDKNLFLQVEAKQISYGAATLDDTLEFKTKATVGTVGLGYKF